MKWREIGPEEELIQAVTRYLEILEEGGDGTAFLQSLGPLAGEVAAIVNVEVLLRVDLPGPTAAELTRGRNRLHQEITAGQRRKRVAGPRLFGVITAAGLGLGLGAAFASGAVTSKPMVALVEALPFVSVEESPGESHGPGIVDERDVGAGHNASPVSSPTSEALENEGLTGNADVPPTTPASENGRGIGSAGTPPGQGGVNPGNRNGGGNGNGVGPDGTPAGQGGANPGNGIGPEATPPGQGGENPRNGDGGPDVTPPGQGGENPRNGDGGPDVTPPGQGAENPANGDGGPDVTPPGQGGDNNGNSNGNGGGNGVGPDGTPPGQGGENPGNGHGNGVGPDATPPRQGGENPGNGNPGSNGNGNND